MTVRRRGLMVLLGLLAIATIVTAVVLAGGPPENEGPGTSAFDPSVPTSTHTPPPASGTAAPADPSDGPAGDPTDPVTVPVSPSAPSPSASGLEEVEAETSPILLAVLEETAEISPEEPSDVVGELSDVATRAFLSELEAERLEFETEGWTRTGDYSFGEVEVLEHSTTSDGEVATVRVCVDSSALVTQRADGQVIETSPESARAWNIFVLERSDSVDWRIVGRTFPDDPAC
ncbi:MAG TPA: hypothetical protein VK122_11105 [Brachybacterium sp.]|nr:hypothetical protein [Candidatus Brachybacterium merdigallinarum]HLQ81632.1 hypothetical protein [Brachybacterium sp.]HLS34354.1 hypothetical protein [Brevibacterium sp.]